MRTEADLKNLLKRIDGRGYKAYKDIRGIYECEGYRLFIDHVQGDPFASSSEVRVRVPQVKARFPEDLYVNQSREIALRDYLTRKFAAATATYCRGNRGTGKSGVILIDLPGQEILERTSVLISHECVEARFVMGLPAYGRTIAGMHASAMFFDELPRIIRASLMYESLDGRALRTHIETAEDADVLRNRLESFNLVAFVADGSILPRASGIDARPLTEGLVVPFQSPESLRVTIQTPNSGSVSGMGIPRGVTLIVGGGYHGKSTLLRALESGVYNHIPGDGRDLIVSNPTAVKIRAEDGRRIEKVNISPFITRLPFGKDTVAFSSENASGSTSQAANIIESLEVGTTVILVDEDTSATNFMIRDHRMQELVSKEKEPITPFIDKIHQLYTDCGVSTILALGGSGDYFDVADCVICMVEYTPWDVTGDAKRIAHEFKSERIPEGGTSFGSINERIPKADSFDPKKGRREVNISCKGLQAIAFGTQTIDLGSIEQLVHVSQTRAIGDAIYYALRYMDGEKSIGEIVRTVMKDMEQHGVGVFSRRPVGDYARFREIELAAAINRLRTLQVSIQGCCEEERIT